MKTEYFDVLFLLGLATPFVLIFGHMYSRAWKRLCLLLITPFLPIAYLIDLIVGDFVTGTPRTLGQKLADHRRMWIEIWREP